MASSPLLRRNKAKSADRETYVPGPAAAPDHEGRFDGLTRLISEWVWEVDSRLRLTYVSERVAAVLGFSPSEMAGKTLHDFGNFTRDGKPFIEKDWCDPFCDVHFEAMDVNGRLRLFLMNGLPNFHPQSGTFAGVHGTAREVDGHTATATTVMGAFLSHLSHDLRTPISTIIGFSGIMVDSPEELSKAQQRTFAEHIHSAGCTLVDLLDDAIDLARIDSGLAVLSADVLDLGEILTDCIAEWAPKAVVRGVSIEDRVSVGRPVRVRADKLHLRRIIHKLLAKAIQSGAHRGRVCIDVEQIDAAHRLRITLFDPEAGADTPGFAGNGQNPSVGKLKRKEGRVLNSVAERLAELMKCRLGYSNEFEGSDTYWIEIPWTPNGIDASA